MDDRNLDDSFDLLDHNLFLDDFNQLFYDFRHFYHFLYHSRDNDKFFDNFLNFNNLWNFDHFLHNSVNMDNDLLNAFDISGDFNDSLLNVLDWFGDFDVVIDDLLDFDELWLVNNHGLTQKDLLDNGVFNSFDERLLDDLSDKFDDFMYDWDLNDLFNLDWHLSDDLDNFFNNDFNWLDDFFSYKFLSDDLNFSDLNFFVNNFNYFLYNCRHFYNALNCLDDWDNFLNDSINWLVDSFDVVVDLKSFAIFYNRHCLFHNTLDNLNF